MSTAKKSAKGKAVTIEAPNEDSLRDDFKNERNPFKMPADNDIFLLRDKERQNKEKEKLKFKTLKVHEKIPEAKKINFRKAANLYTEEIRDDDDDIGTRKSMLVKDDPKFILAVTKNRHVEKESLSEYIDKKREMFLVQYSLSVKRNEMRKLEELATAEEKKLELAEQLLEEDAAMFDEFLKENDRTSGEATKAADLETKKKNDRVQEFKKMNAQLAAIKSEMSKLEDQLRDYKRYEGFLVQIAPKEWKDKREAVRRQKIQDIREQRALELKKERAALQTRDSVDSDKNAALKRAVVRQKAIRYFSDRSPRPLSQEQSKLSMKSQVMGSKKSPSNLTHSSIKEKSKTSMESEVEADNLSDISFSDDEDDELYFKNPENLLDIFMELEEQNLSLIQNSQDTETALDDMKHQIKQTEVKMEAETKLLNEQINRLNSMIVKEQNKADEAETKIKMFDVSDADQDKQEKYLELLSDKVAEVYKSCIGDNEANIGSLQMMINIENRMEELFEKVETLPHDKVEAAERSKNKERNLRMKEEKLQKLKELQEERTKKALERAKEPPKKHVGRRPVFRSQPPPHRRRQDKEAIKASKEEEELAYFFT